MKKDFPIPLYAGFWLRFWAYLIDTAVIRAITTIIGLSHPSFHMVIFLLYFILLTKLNHGQTLGKMVLGVRVVAAHKENLDWLTVLFREGICRYIIETIPFTIILYLVIAFTTKKQGLPDMISDTYVMKDELLSLWEQEAEPVEPEPVEETWLFN